MGKIKICGITNATDAQLASKLGADALGFNFCPESPRFVARERVRAIVASLPPFVTAVAVFVDAHPEFMSETCDFCGIRTVQLHGDEAPGIVGKLRAYKIIKAFQVRSERDTAQIRRYDVDAFLLDAYVAGKRGGTGTSFNWDLAKSVACVVPILLAGGLNPENVGQAIRTVKPYGVDVCSGVESEPGKKDRRLLRQFIEEARKAFLDTA
jgi:phosphoribosylanthranilate isomerase